MRIREGNTTSLKGGNEMSFFGYLSHPTSNGIGLKIKKNKLGTSFGFFKKP